MAAISHGMLANSCEKPDNAYEKPANSRKKMAHVSLAPLLTNAHVSGFIRRPRAAGSGDEGAGRCEPPKQLPRAA
jgi:hypothetical protein